MAKRRADPPGPLPDNGTTVLDGADWGPPLAPLNAEALAPPLDYEAEPTPPDGRGRVVVALDEVLRLRQIEHAAQAYVAALVDSAIVESRREDALRELTRLVERRG
jgi:hypothetical protein